MAMILNVSRSGYYRYLKAIPSQREQENEILLKEIQRIHRESRQTYGSPRIHAELKRLGHQCSRRRVARLMKKANIRAKMVKQFKVTTKINTSHPIAANALAQDFTAQAPNKKWVADITYVRTVEGWLYLAIILDLFSRKIVGIAMDDSLNKALVIQALNQALTRRKVTGDLIHHSDKGCQYTSQAFQTLLAQADITCSMSGTGNCFDNAVAESFFHTLKTEHVYFECYQTREQAKASIFEYIEIFYNNQRKHSYLNYLSPVEFEKNHYQKQNAVSFLNVH
jgi:putative transposase